MNSANKNLHNYYKNHVFLHNFVQLDMGEFKDLLAKM